MRRPSPNLFFALVAALSAFVSVRPATAQGQGGFAGDYVCDYGCRLTDAPPSIKINGDVATCWNEFGGVYQGWLASKDEIYCFNKFGRLSGDRNVIRWDDGVVWKRLSRPPS